MEPEELGDPGDAELVEALVRAGEVLEPLEAARVRGGGGREGLGVGGEGLLAVAGLREELGVLLEDLEVLLCNMSISSCLEFTYKARLP